MKLKSARDSLETALHFAETEPNPIMEHLIDGLIDMTKAIEKEASEVMSKLNSIESRINQIR